MTPAAPDPIALFLLLIAGLNFFVWIWYSWKYSAAVQEISGVRAVMLFLFWIIFPPVSMVITQAELNKKAGAEA